jgi:glycosyltransferase involved in cell wall biosynthesis
MRITHISILHRPFDTRIFAKQCTTLALAGHDVHLVVGGAPAEELDGVRLHTIASSTERPPARRQWPRFLRAWVRAFRLRPSTFHLHDPHLIPLGIVLKLAGSRVVYDVHEDYPAHARTKLAGHPVRSWLKASMWEALEWAAAHTLDRFVCASPAVAKRFPPDRTVVVHNFALHETFARARANGEFRPYAERSNTVVYAGDLSDIRGFWDMLEAIALVRADLDCRLRLIGRPRGSRIAQAAESAERVDPVEWAEPFSEVVRELFAAKAGLVLLHEKPNHEAIRSNKLFEYMAAGIPVIASDLPGWREIVLGTGCGLVAGPSDQAAVARAIEYLLTHPDEAEEMGERGRAAVRERFNWDGEAGRLLSLYRDLHAVG